MAYIHSCIVSDVAGIKSNTVNSSDYNSKQDPKFKYKSDSQSNSMIDNKKLKIKNLSNQLIIIIIIRAQKISPEALTS